MQEAITGIIGAAVLGVIGWAVQLSNRVTSLEGKDTAVRELLEVRFDDIRRRLDRIEQKVDERH